MSLGSWGDYITNIFSSSNSKDEDPEESKDTNVQVVTHDVVFDHPSIKRDEYWQHAMEPGFEFFIYERKNGNAKPEEISYSDNGSTVYRKTKVEIVDSQNSTMLLGIFSSSSDPSPPIVYVSTQRKCKLGTFTIAYENVFEGEWKTYVPLMKGVVVLKDSPTPENPNRFIQRFTIEFRINNGWSSKGLLSRIAGSVTESWGVSTAKKILIEKSNELPDHFLDFISREEYLKTVQSEYIQTQ
jgi:hypothetical protein